MTTELVVSFRGRLPSRGQVSAYTAFESMLALSQATTMVLHFGDTGTIRRKNFAKLGIDLRLKDTREGSFEFLLEYKSEAAYLAGFVANAAAGGLTWDLMKGAIQRVIGGAGSGAVDQLESHPDFKDGDLGALVQAIEPAVRRAHGAINRGATKIVISVEGGEDEVVFDERSKAYLLENMVNDTIRTQRFMVTSFDGRARTGRMFHLEDEQAYTFELSKNANYKALEVIADAAYAYALRSSGQFDQRLEAVFRFSSIDAVDGRIKKIVVYQAATSFDELDAQSFDPDA